MTARFATPLATADASPARASVARSHVGRVRVINEDRILDYPSANLWAVADGMGGHRGGDLAAQAVVDGLRTLATSGGALDLTAILATLSQANADICRRNEATGANAGTTVVVATIADDVASIAWIGDSRAYRLRDGRLELLTRDHSVVQDLIDAGLLTPAQAERHPRANVITRALGVSEQLECQTLKAVLEPNDRLLLCSDGLSRSMSIDDIWEGNDDTIVDAMTMSSLDRDGTDNISLVLIR